MTLVRQTFLKKLNRNQKSRLTGFEEPLGRDFCLFVKRLTPREETAVQTVTGHLLEITLSLIYQLGSSS